MKETPLSNCERNFILKAASELKRLDGRKLEDFRNLKVHFGHDWGLCYVSLGETKVVTQVTCEIQEPKTTRPNEGLLFVNVELSPMAAPHFESGRASDLSVHVNRLLEKCIKDSRAVDLESLCIVAEEKVWVLRVDVNVLNHEGSLVDCASISALAALAHFKRPDVTTNGVEIKVHSVLERDPIPITLHHYPVCVSFALLNNSENIFADPTMIEERVSDANLTFGINSYKEICCLHLGGSALTIPKLILTCSTRAAARAKKVVEVIKEALQQDAEARRLKRPVGFVDNFQWDKVTALSESSLKIQLTNYPKVRNTPVVQDEILTPEENSKNFEIINLGENCAELRCQSKLNESLPGEEFQPRKFLEKDKQNGVVEKSPELYGEGGPSQWEVNIKISDSVADFDSCSSDQEKDQICVLPVPPKQNESIELSGDSEEEVVILTSHELNNVQTNLTKVTPIKKIGCEEKPGWKNLKKNTQSATPYQAKKNKKKKNK